MIQEEIDVVRDEAYYANIDNGLIGNLDGSVGFKIGWEAAVELLNKKQEE